MTPLEIAKKALSDIANQRGSAWVVAMDALTEIAIAEQEAPKPSPAAVAGGKRLFGRHH